MLFENLEPYLRLLGALVLALPIAWDRERHTQIAGLRTFPLVAVGACGYVLIGQAFIGPDNPDATARIMQGLLSGIGFVGGGAILKQRDHVKGTASAASIWITGALGAAVGFGYWGYGIALAGLNFAIILTLSPIKEKVADEPGKDD